MAMADRHVLAAHPERARAVRSAQAHRRARLLTTDPVRVSA